MSLETFLNVLDSYPVHTQNLYLKATLRSVDCIIKSDRVNILAHYSDLLSALQIECDVNKEIPGNPASDDGLSSELVSVLPLIETSL